MTITKEGEKEHHLYGGSSARYWSNCFGWASKIVKLPYQAAGAAADKGTALHVGILERKTPAEIEHRRVGTPVNVSYDDIPNWPGVEGEEIANDFWEKLWKNVLEEIITDKHVWIERKLMLFPDQDAGGTADIVVMYKDDKNKVVCVLGDLKTGRIQVEPDDEQMLVYITAAYLRALEKGIDIDIFKTFIYQPTSEEKFKPGTLTKNKILSAVKKYQKAIIESKKEKPKFKAGSWCEYCKVQSDCLEYHKHLSKQMDLDVSQDKPFPEVDTLPDEKILNIWKHGDQIEEYISQARKFIIRRFMEGKPIEGLKIVGGVSKRRFKDKMLAEDKLREIGINPMKESLMGITAISAMLKNHGLSKVEIDGLFLELAPKPPQPPKITTSDDPKPALDISKPDLLGSYDEEGEEDDSE